MRDIENFAPWGISESMKAERIWETIACEDSPIVALSRELGVSPVTARLLCIRGLGAPDDARRFLSPRIDDLHDPFRLAGMSIAVDRILGAIGAKDRIAIHGDYDVDGVTSTVILRRALELLGADVIHFIPERFRDGYGLQPATIDRLQQDGVRLIISVDCGIRADEAATRARELGIDLIITDHHEPGAELPHALAVINPKRHDCTYPDKNLAGVGVALKLVQALCTCTGHAKWLPAFVKVAAIGTLADVVPLTGENRIIAKLGLGMLSTGPHKVGLRALLEVCGLTGREIDSYHIGFVLAPRVNAAGRMSTPDIAARLLLAADETMGEEARALAEQLDAENLRRQQEEADIVSEARKIVETDLPTGYGPFRIHAFESGIDGQHHVALVLGDLSAGDEPALVRVHSQCLTGDIFASSRCDCGDQLHKALEMISQAGRGVLLYLRQEGRGIGLVHKLMAYQLQDQGKDTVEANEALGFKPDQRDYGIGAQILVELGVKKMRILTNNPRKFVGLEGYGLEVVGRLPIEIPASDANRRYLKTKKEKLGHILRSV